ncbi:MAG: glutamine synthetase III [Bacteroidota bacterium]|nr:glutamine synthetase III [Bacteroidota bacterium]
MSTYRITAIEDVLERAPKALETPSRKISEYYGDNAFTLSAMREYLTEEAYDHVVAATQDGIRIDRKIADQVASSLKEWAMARGATHYTHWFQPLTGSTAEKHDSFIQPDGRGGAIERFDGSLLVQQEPDASSFPNGGIRSTFEARGYTLWDPSSAPFIMGTTLCIPTIFIAYTGQSLDNKAPLLKALAAVDKAATNVCQYFDKNVTKVVATLGWEQEYFLVDKALYNARPDLSQSGRALLGAAPAKGQQLDDNYFGSIPPRVMSFMQDFECEAHKLGIPVTTRHNEVAPNQFEVAPVFEEANLANDHNLLLMELLETVAQRHDFRVLMHEKPFAGLNGSGKHNNWSLGTNTGVNLLKPGTNPKTNLRFLTFFVNTIAAIHRHADVLRAAIASAGNDHRLGANEAPPAIISAFIGSKLTELLDAVEENVTAGKMSPDEKTAVKLEIGRIPEVLLDNTDRNRTSPFAFTGNKFEFRAVGSAANCAVPMTVLNTIMAEQLNMFKAAVDARIAGGDKKDEALLKEIQKLIKESKAIRFEGNGYGQEWVDEAAKRGLSNLLDTPSALAVWERKEVVDLFDGMGVLSAEEVAARTEVELENYVMKLQIEARVLGDMVTNQVLPAVMDYQSDLLANVQGFMDVFGDNKADAMTTAQRSILEELSAGVSATYASLEAMRSERSKINEMDDLHAMAKGYAEVVKPLMEEVRIQVDQLEKLTEDGRWPFPKLRELLFTR